MKGALVTGAGMRVGRALAMALAADGFFAFVHYNRSAGPARETVAAITAAGGKAKAADFDLHMAVNLRAPLLLSQAVARQLPASETGVIVNMLDQKLFNLNSDFLTYTLSKVGLQGLTTLLAQSFAPRLRVAGIAPGLTLRSGSQTDARFAQQHTENPLRVGVTPADLVRALRFIMATPTFTGDVLIVDSGEHLSGRPRDIAFDTKTKK